MDAESTDKTVDIAKEYTEKIYIKKWEGYAKAKNFGIEKAASEWILSIDADERLTDSLKKEILKISNEDKFDVYYITWLLFFLWLSCPFWWLFSRLADETF